MGQSADAKLAWAIDFGDRKNTSEGYEWGDTRSYDFEETVMPALFGFTEAAPHLPDRQFQDLDARRQWRETVRLPWEQRRDAAIPLTFEHYGYAPGGTALVLKRSLTHVEWGAKAVDVATLAVPTVEELAAFGLITDHLGYVAGPPALLLMAFYG